MVVGKTVTGPAAPWVAPARAGGLREHIAGNLAAFERRAHPTSALKTAAVVIVVAATDDGGSFFLTRRSPRLRSHAGQWALPGGRLDAGETVSQAALREVAEEIGLAIDPAAILGVLDDYPTRSGYVITPVVVWAGTAPRMTPNPAEVASIHEIPLAELDRPGSPEFVVIPESERLVIRLHLGDNRVHAPTAAVLYQFREVCLHGLATRVAEYEQPVFAWR